MLLAVGEQGGLHALQAFLHIAGGAGQVPALEALAGLAEDIAVVKDQAGLPQHLS